jgi:hypothetical protein
MNHSTSLHVLNSLNKLIHDQCYLSFYQLVSFNMLKEFTTSDLLHDNVHVLLSFIHLPHLDNILVTDQSNDLVLFSLKVFFSFCQSGFVNLFHGNDILSFFVLTLINGRELTIAKLPSLNVIIFKTEVVSLLFEMPDPILNSLLIFMV